VIVCPCHAVSDRTLAQVVARGAGDAEAIRITGAGTACGICRTEVAAALAVARELCEARSPCPDCPRRGPGAAGRNTQHGMDQGKEKRASSPTPAQ